MTNINSDVLIAVPSGTLKISEMSNILKFSLILPTYNESANIGQIIDLLTQLLDQILPNQYELIIVDDNSPDYT
ncbi:MAG TPA: glycosyltransferase [Allocoleopsis sp.]